MEERLLAILRLALKQKASDIHLTMRYSEILIEMRVEDELRRVKSQPGDEKLIRYLQYLANLDVGNLTLPQTGQFEMVVDQDLLSIRFSVIHSLNFTNGVLRILNADLAIPLTKLSMLPKQNQFFAKLLQKDAGLVLLSGPTGSGKTTTLYSLLKSVQHLKIFTIEDPIEVYHDEFIQLSVNEAAGFGYFEGIKQILRHDPDIIMIGEIRDEKAAKMAVQAANTGHLVFSTIHASRASGCISRMMELGVREDHLYEVLLALSNQRMVLNADHEKAVVYEIMDQKEISYFRQHNVCSENFHSIYEQIEKGILNGTIEKEL